MPKSIEEVGDNWFYYADEFAEARAVSTMTCQTILQYFPEGGHICELLLMGIMITGDDLDDILDEWV